jgi:FMN phosphatase YigB (HAD superfamily)
MGALRPFRTLSLDLWFTTLYYPSGADDLWRSDRIRVLGHVLRSRDGTELAPEKIETAMEFVHAGLRSQDRGPATVNPRALVEAYAEELDARFAIPAEGAGLAFSSAGLDEHPPLLNPEFNPLVRTLREREIPVIAITNTARREDSWKLFFNSRADFPFAHIITSCEVGRAKPAAEIFADASNRLGLAPQEILHVGDRWELDLVGARNAGFGAILYRGLWPQYPQELYSETKIGPPADPDVRCIDRLAELLEGSLLESSFRRPADRGAGSRSGV